MSKNDTLTHKVSRRRITSLMAGSLALGFLAIIRPRGATINLRSVDDLVQQIMASSMQSIISFKQTISNYGGYYKSILLPGTKINDVDITSSDFVLSLDTEVKKHVPDICSKHVSAITRYYKLRYTPSELEILSQFMATSAGQKMVFDHAQIGSELDLATRSARKMLDTIFINEVSQRASEKKSLS